MVAVKLGGQIPNINACDNSIRRIQADLDLVYSSARCAELVRLRAVNDYKRCVAVTNSVKSPCIGVCSTGIGDTVCRGCKRYAHEIICWNGYSTIEKRAILGRLDSLLSQVVQAKLEITNTALLETQLQQQKIHYNTASQPYSWVFDLLKAGASQINNLEDFGCVLKPEFATMTMVALRDSIDADFYILSSVHYERYFDVTDASE